MFLPSVALLPSPPCLFRLCRRTMWWAKDQGIDSAAPAVFPLSTPPDWRGPDKVRNYIFIMLPGRSEAAVLAFLALEPDSTTVK